MLAALFDLVLPAECAGCGVDGAGGPLCARCVVALSGVQPQRVHPDPEPPGLPRTYALAAYDGALRAALLAYKERGRHALAAPLGDHLARVVTRALAHPSDGATSAMLLPPWPAEAASSPKLRLGRPARPAARSVLLVPVPATAAAARRRHGDHVRRLAERAARTLRRSGVPAGVLGALRALPRVDSAELSAAERAIAARTAFAARSRRLRAVRAAAARGVAVVLVDDIVTTGVTIAAASAQLGGVAFAAVLAATQRRAHILH